MTFLNPLGLIGLIALPVIVILHLLRERQRRYVVSDLGLWAFLDLQVRGPRTRRIPITPLLLLDLIIAALISLAWAQPSLAVDLAAEQAKHLVVVMDVSSSMLAGDGGAAGGSRFAQAQSQAAGLVEATGPGDRVTLVTFGRQARLAYDSRTSSEQGLPAEAVLALQAGESGASGTALREALALGQAALSQDLPAEFHIFTDGAYSEAGLADFLGEIFPYGIEWHWIGEAQQNQAIVALNVTELGEDRAEVFVRIANSGNREVSRQISLKVNQRISDQTTLSLPADSAVAYVWQIQLNPEADAPYVEVELSGSDILPEDDRAYSGLQPGGEVRVALVAEDAAVLQQAIEAVPGVAARLFTPEAYAAAIAAGDAGGYDLTIFRGVLPGEWPAGDILIVEPPAGGSSADEAPGAAALQTEGSRSILAGAPVLAPNPSPLIEGIDFSSVRWVRAARLEQLPQGFVALLQAGDAHLLLNGDLQNSTGGISRAWVLLADFDSGNFTKHPAYPILVANMIEQSRRAPLPASFKTGQPLRLPAAGNYARVRVTTPAGESFDWQDRWPTAWQETTRPGIYRVELTEAGGRTAAFAAGANAGDENESDLRPRAWTETAPTNQAQAANLPGEEDPSFDLWPWLLAGAALVMLAEAWLAWRR